MSREKITQLRRWVTPFENTDVRASIRQLINTISPFILFWFLAYQALNVSVWLTVGLSVIAAGFVVRIFIIFHDCTHGSFFKNKKANEIVGTITGILTLFTFEKWKREHSIHHASSGNLDKRGVGDIWIMTIEEFVKASRWERLKYRMYRNPFIMFGLGPLYLVLISSRLNRKDAHKKERNNTYLINISIIIIYSLLIWAIGWQAFLIIQGTTMFTAGALGIWLFYIQHTFEDSYFEAEGNWDYVKAAVEGSSYYRLPKVLQWITGNIGFHHVHHLNPRVPNYNLEKAHKAVPPLQQATTINLKSSLKSLRYKLYDAKNKTFVTFGDIKELLDETKVKTNV
ncbi:omega-6 fatty acid desaturase (delta-12 desaturase) [Evansella caseinilytica]|uniref:Omega-6 fatty acid desaturase (Delta-12 desaturase) n=1 Tax=Evansella caseinilytica TaxID=1503961 RepID=A0A1H3LVZ1_9BACI|nr:fatty acid desaturase [Evansella caseinilytica]SDY68493.1 omega-6 fatty acid desaturase (delta-12 desaturase) [Evansella caseinilytica]